MTSSYGIVGACAAGVALLVTCGLPPTHERTPVVMEAYSQVIPGTSIQFDMVPIRGGEFLMGSPADEPGRRADEGPQRRVRVSSFWMGRCEVTWDEYDLWSESQDLRISTDESLRQRVDGVSRPTPAYTDMAFDMGREGYPAICMTQHAARTYCEWLSAATGVTYRLPTEAEWEYACRAGTTTAYSFGADAEALEQHAWFADNSDEEYGEVGQKSPNPWGLHDMHGNVAEWVLDQFLPELYAAGPVDDLLIDPLVEPTKLYPRVVRGGSWQDPPEQLRSAARRGSHPDWKEQDPQIPKSIWYHTDALFVGFRVVRPLTDGDEVP